MHACVCAPVHTACVYNVCIHTACVYNCMHACVCVCVGGWVPLAGAGSLTANFAKGGHVEGWAQGFSRIPVSWDIFSCSVFSRGQFAIRWGLSAWRKRDTFPRKRGRGRSSPSWAVTWFWALHWVLGIQLIHTDVSQRSWLQATETLQLMWAESQL